MQPVEYHLIQRALGRWSTWRPFAGIGLLIAAELILVQIVLVALFAIALLALGSDDVGGDLQRVLDTDHVTPAGLAYLNATLALAIPVTMGIVYLLHRLPPGSLASVAGHIRWRWLLTCLGLSVLALMATLVVSSFLPAQEGDVGGSLNDWTAEVRTFAIVILLLTPLQAAGEEYAFRGYLTQAFGGLFRSRVAAVLLPAFLFALAHGAQDLPIFFDRFAFGIVAGILVITTGGLEAGIAMHVLNNFLAFGIALAFSDMTSALNPTGGSWWNIPVTLTQSLVYLALVFWAVRRKGIRTTVDRSTEPVVLEGPEPRV
jgi:CAAX protease family protein